MLRDTFWDFGCLASVVGVWPRFIEPNLLKITRIKLAFPLKLKLALFSDLHLHPGMREAFLKKIKERCLAFQPDLLFFLGDFLCEGRLEDRQRLSNFLSSFSFCQNCFAVVGNHDYSEPLSVSSQGDYDIKEDKNFFTKAFQRLTFPLALTKKVTPRARNVKKHSELWEIIENSPFKLLYNETVQRKGINITGLGEYMAFQADPKKAFLSYENNLPGITLVHNPDMVPHLHPYPGHLILCGHTHGGQINLPLVWRRLTLMENPHYKYGLVKENEKTIYVTRGVGSVKTFRLNAPPEVVFMELSP